MNELSAVYFTRKMIKKGIRVPEDISVLSLGNSLMSEISTPQLTCVDLQDKTLGMKSAEMIVQQIQSENFKRVNTLLPEIVKRESA